VRRHDIYSFVSEPHLETKIPLLINKSRNLYPIMFAFSGNFTTASRTALEPTQPPIHWVSRVFYLGVKRPGCEADHSPPSSAEVKECMELYLCSPNTTSWRGAHLKKHRDNFTFTSPRPDRFWRPTNQLSYGYVGGGSFPGVKRPGREVDHSPPSSAEFNNAWIYTSTLPVCLHGVVLN
jgi:hypothetical protein